MSNHFTETRSSKSFFLKCLSLDYSQNMEFTNQELAEHDQSNQLD